MYAVPLILGLTLFPAAVELLRVNPYVIQAGLTALFVVIGYLGHKHISFRRPSPD